MNRIFFFNSGIIIFIQFHYRCISTCDHMLEFDITISIPRARVCVLSWVHTINIKKKGRNWKSRQLTSITIIFWSNRRKIVPKCKNFRTIVLTLIWECKTLPVFVPKSKTVIMMHVKHIFVHGCSFELIIRCVFFGYLISWSRAYFFRKTVLIYSAVHTNMDQRKKICKVPLQLLRWVCK